MSNPGNAEYFAADDVADPLNTGFLLSRVDNPLDVEVGELINHTKAYKEPENVALRNDSTAGAVLGKLFISSDDTIAIIKTDTDVSVVTDTQNIKRVARLREKRKELSQNYVEISPIASGTAGAALGFIAMAAWHARDALLNVYTATTTERLLTGAATYLSFDVMSAVFGFGAGRLLGSVAEFSINEYKATRELQTKYRTKKEIKNLVNKSDFVTLPATPNVVNHFNEAVMAMLLNSRNSKDFWDHHVSPTVKMVAKYDQRISQLQVANNETNPDEEDEHVLRFKAQSAVHSLIKVYQERRRNS